MWAPAWKYFEDVPHDSIGRTCDTGAPDDLEGWQKEGEDDFKNCADRVLVLDGRRLDGRRGGSFASK